MCTADGNYIPDTVFQGERSIKQSTSRTEEIIQERPDSTSWRIWRNFLQPMCYAGSSKLLTNDETQLGRWTSTIHTSSRLWPYYYSVSENTVYRGYREDWHSNEKYQFDAYQGNDAELFDFNPIDRNIEIKYMPTDAIPVDTVCTPRGWRVCQHQPRTVSRDPLPPITDFI